MDEDILRFQVSMNHILRVHVPKTLDHLFNQMPCKTLANFLFPFYEVTYVSIRHQLKYDVNIVLVVEKTVNICQMSMS